MQVLDAASGSLLIWQPENICRHYDERDSWGLLNMHERAQLIGGRLDIGSTPDQGISMALMVPISIEAELYANAS